MTAFPNEWDSEVGGVLTMLLEPAVVKAIADEIEDDEEEVDGESIIRDGIALASLTAEIFWTVLPCTEADGSLENFGGLEPLVKLACVVVLDVWILLPI